MEFFSDPLNIVIAFATIYFGGVIHELGHGYAALYFGDDTAKLMGRLTINPIAHFDFIKTLVMPVVLLLTVGIPFGGMKPVPVNPHNFDNYYDWKAYRKADIAVSLAGPAFQIAFSIIFLIVFLLLTPIIKPLSYAFNLFFIGFMANVLIAFFNLIPIPPLDGSHVFKYFLSTKNRTMYESIGQQFGFFFLIAFVVLGGTVILNPIYNGLLHVFLWAYQHLSLAVLIN